MILAALNAARTKDPTRRGSSGYQIANEPHVFWKSSDRERFGDLADRYENALKTLTESAQTVSKKKRKRKDEALDRLSEVLNVAQFVGFEPANGKPRQTYSRIRGESSQTRYETLRRAIEVLLTRSSERAINVRSYSPHDPQSKPFSYGLTTIDEAEQVVRARVQDGLHVIVNETIDKSDGGFSGVAQNGIAEFAPDDTPRCVEKPDPSGQDPRQFLVGGCETQGCLPASRKPAAHHPPP